MNPKTHSVEKASNLIMNDIKLLLLFLQKIYPFLLILLLCSSTKPFAIRTLNNQIGAYVHHLEKLRELEKRRIINTELNIFRIKDSRIESMNELSYLTDSCKIYARDCINLQQRFQTLNNKSNYIKILEGNLPELIFNLTPTPTAEQTPYPIQIYSLSSLFNTLDSIHVQIQELKSQIFKVNITMSNKESNTIKLNKIISILRAYTSQ